MHSEVQPDLLEIDGRTLLSWSVGRGHNEVGKLQLAEKDVNPNIADNDGKSPLFGAIHRAHKGAIVTILLLSRYATGNERCILSKQVSLFYNRGWGTTILADSTELSCLSWVIRRRILFW